MKDGKKRVLIVDDTKQISRIMQRLLSELDLSVDTAGGGLEAIEMFFSAMQTGMPYDLAILDFEMPDMNGAKLLGELKKLDCAVKAILHSGNEKSDVFLNYLDHGFVGRLSKPSDPEDINSLVMFFLG